MQLDKRPAGTADIPFLLELRQATMSGHLLASGAPLSTEAHMLRLMHHFDCAQILLHEGNPVGLLKVRRTAAEWEIVQIQLSSKLQGRGFGRILVQQVLDEASVPGVPVKLSVLKANPARKLYESLGFVVTGEDNHEYFMQFPES